MSRPSLPLFNHVSPRLSELEATMVAGIPEGGNWQDIPSGLSARVDQIRRRSAERGLVHTTYYGRLRWDMPSYTINTYFSRIGNGCFIHPAQPRLISLREGARLQSFPDSVRFHGPRRAQYEQIGNAVPPLLAYAVARTLKQGTAADLFSGAGGLSLGFELAGSTITYAADGSEHACATFNEAHGGEELAEPMDLSKASVRREVVRRIRRRVDGAPDLLLAGPPCQGFSTAGNRSHKDARSQLLWTPFEIARALKPAVLIVENVHGILSIAQRSVPGRIAREMTDLGFTPHMCVLRAEEYGVPQRRTRVFFIGARGSTWAPPEPVCSRGPEVDSIRAPVSVREAISDLPPLEPDSGKDEGRLRRQARSEFQRWARSEIDAERFLEERFHSASEATVQAA
jgi:DNA (cytosine-5)-methyltransferase 1